MVTLNNQMSGSSDNQTGQMTIVLTEAVDFRIGSEMMDGLDWSDGLGDSDASILAALKEANPNVKFDNGRIPAGTRLVIPEIEGLSRADWFETERNRPVLGFGGTRAGGRLFGDARLEGTEGTDFQTINTAEFTSEQLRDLFDRYTYTAQADAFAAYNGIAMSTLEDVLNGERELSSLGATVRIPLRDPFKGGRIEYDDRSFLPSAASEEQRGSGPAENTNNTVATAGSMVAEVPTEHQAAVIAVLEASMERGPYGRANRGGRPRSEAYIPLERIEGYASLKENVPNLDAIIAQHRADGGTTLAGRENTTVTDREELGAKLAQMMWRRQPMIMHWWRVLQLVKIWELAPIVAGLIGLMWHAYSKCY